MFSRSVQLFKASFAVVAANRRLLLLPVLSMISLVAIVALAIVPTLTLSTFADIENAFFYAYSVVLLYVLISTGLFFQTALVAAARRHFDGHTPTLRYALSHATGLLPQILGWAVVVTVVKMFLRWVREKGILGAIFAGLADVIFTFATFITVPVLVSERLGPVAALRRSASLLRQTWGENIIGRLGMGLIAGVTTFVIAGVGVLGVLLWMSGSTLAGVAIVAFAVVGVAATSALFSALNAVYATALYRYATDAPVDGFDIYDLSSAFKTR